MAISFVGSTKASAANGGNVTLDLTLITGLAQDDLVIVSYSIGTTLGDRAMSISTAGYTEVADLFSDDSYDANLGVYYKLMPASPDTSAVAVGSGTTSDSTAAIAMAFRGVDTTTPLESTTTTATGLNTTAADPPSITWSTAGTWTVIAGASSHAIGAGSAYTLPTGYTTNGQGQFSDDTDDTTVAMGYKTSPATPEDPAALTHNGTDDVAYSWAAATLALRPAGAGGGTSTHIIVVGI